MKIGIIGGGSIGLLLSRYLCEYHNVTLYVRRQGQKEALNEHGLFLSNTETPLPIRARLIEEIGEEDCFIVCVKQYQIRDVLPSLYRIDKQIPFLFLQNGMGHLEKLNKLNSDIYVGVIDHGALKESDYCVDHTGKGKINIATYRGSAETLSILTEKLNQPDFPVVTSMDWEQLLAKKLIVNAVINPITTLFNVPNKDVLTNPYLYHLAEKLCYEAATVLHLEYKTELERVRKIANQTGNNKSSMLTDIENQRQTEIDSISGYIIENSNSEVPYTSFVYDSVKAIEYKHRIGKAYD